jgi:hypothetical protein
MVKSEHGNRPVITFTARRIYGKIYMKPYCDRSEILCRLIGRPLEVSELSLVSKLGFDISVVGDKKEFKEEEKRISKDPSPAVNRVREKWR